ncbi:MAG: PHP domain-containing protein [Egibacteraceae bacterium]
MWRVCDLHNHTQPNERDSSAFDAQQFVTHCLNAGLDVVAVTDHDDADQVAAVIEAARATQLVVVPGVEISTDPGHPPGAGTGRRWARHDPGVLRRSWRSPRSPGRNRAGARDQTDRVSP